MGVSPWQTPLQLYKEMKGITPPKSMNPAMQRGVDQEDAALEWLMMTTGKTFTSAVGTYRGNDRIIASLDGLSSDGKLIAEIKCSQKIYDAALKGVISSNYIYQIQQQMMVFDIEKALFVAFDGFEGVIIEVDRDESLIKELLEAEIAFLECLDTDTPPAYEESDHVEVVLERDDIINQWISLNQQIKYLSILEKEQRSLVEALGDSGNIEFCSSDGTPLLRLTRVKKEGSVDWRKLCEEKNITDKEIEAHRKEQIGYYRYQIVKKEGK